MVQEHKRLNEIAEFFGESPESIKKKISRLKLEVVVHAKKNQGDYYYFYQFGFA